MGIISLVIPQIGQPDTTEDVKLQNALTTIQTAINGNIDTTNLTAPVAQSAGINASGQTVKGATIIATAQTASSAAYATLATPDQVTGIVLTNPGLIAVWYQATWNEGVSSATSASIFVGANQLKIAGFGGPAGQSAGIAGTAGSNNVLATYGGGLVSGSNEGYTTDVTTGQALGSGLSATAGAPCYIFAAAGTYTISVQFKVSSGTATVSSRRLYVQAISFA